MLIEDINTHKVTFLAPDIKQALIMYAKSRGEIVTEESLQFNHDDIKAISTITKQTEPKKV